VTSIRRRQIVGSLNAAIATATLIKNIVRHVKYSTVEELINIIKAIGRRLMDANPRGTSPSSFI
jgi:translation initiation factor eIF-2B subunit beta